MLGEIETMKNSCFKLDEYVAKHRASALALSNKVFKEIQDTCNSVHEMILKTSTVNDRGDQLVEISKTELEKHSRNRFPRSKML
jgi:hypothetical protein